MTKHELWGKVKKYGCLLAAPIIVFILLLIIYAIKGVFPFGNNNISYYDMSQSLIPIYYHTYDFLHGKTGLFFNWFTGSGCTMVDTAGNFVLNPINLFFLFVRRDSILESMSFFLMLKMALCAFNMALLTKRKWENLDNCWVIGAGIAYSTSGFVLQYYCNIHFMDIVILFPLLVLAYDRLLTQNKRTLYIFILTLCFITNIYLSFMLCIYLILSGAFSLHYQVDANKKETVAWEIAVCTMDALLLSAVVTIPNILALMQSSRAQKTGNSNYFTQIAEMMSLFDGQKHFMLYGSEIGIALLLIYFLSKRNRKCQGGFLKRSIWMIVLLILPVFIEPINQIWHMGGYVHFPLRFGYMICLEIWMFVCEWVSMDKQEKIPGTIVKVATLCAPAMIPLIVLIINGFFSLFLQFGIRNEGPYDAYWLVVLLLFVYYVFVGLSAKNEKNLKYTKTLCLIMIIIQAGFGMYGFIAPTDETSMECEDDVIEKSQSLQESFHFDQDILTKIKDSDANLNANYGFILGEGSLANWILGVEAGAQEEFRMLGYSTSYTRVLDNGGTIFSDALLGVNESIMSRQMKSAAYELFEQEDKLYHYRSKYTINPGIILSEEQLDKLQKLNYTVKVSDVNITPFQYQNALYYILAKKEKSLIQIVDNKQYITNTKKDNENGYNCFELEIPIEEAAELYLYSTKDHEFYIEDELVHLPILSFQDNYFYPIEFRNGIVDGGSFENQTVHLKVLTSYENLNYLQIGLLKLADMQTFVDSCESSPEANTINMDSMVIQKETTEGYLFLPIAYHDGYHITVNGQAVEPTPFFEDAFFAIPVGTGVSTISIHYVPVGFKIGFLFSCLGIAGLILIYWIKKKYKIFSKVCYILFTILFAGIVLFVYLIPLLSFILIWIQKWI